MPRASVQLYTCPEAFLIVRIWLIPFLICLQPEKITIPVQAHGGEEDGFEVGLFILELRMLCFHSPSLRCMHVNEMTLLRSACRALLM